MLPRCGKRCNGLTLHCRSFTTRNRRRHVRHSLSKCTRAAPPPLLRRPTHSRISYHPTTRRTRGDQTRSRTPARTACRSVGESMELAIARLASIVESAKRRKERNATLRRRSALPLPCALPPLCTALSPAPTTAPVLVPQYPTAPVLLVPHCPSTTSTPLPHRVLLVPHRSGTRSAVPHCPSTTSTHCPTEYY
jgi:hypothetical protein